MKENQEMTERENILRLFRGEKPFWFPETNRSMLWVCGKSLDDLERPHYESGKDWFGIQWELQEAMGNVGVTHPDPQQKPILEDIADWKEVVVFPDLEEVDWKKIGKEVAESYKTLNGRLPYFMLEHGAFERLTLLMGVEEALVALLEDPESCREYAEAMADFKIRVFDKILELAPYEMVMYQDDIGSGHGPLMSVDTYCEIFKEPLRRVIEHVHEKGLLFGYHSCGRMEAFMEDLLELGIDLVDPVQVCNDQATFVEKYGNRVVIHSGINNQEIIEIFEPEEEKLRGEVRRAVDMFGPTGRYIFKVTPTKMSKNGVNTQEIMYDEFDRYTEKYYE